MGRLKVRSDQVSERLILLLASVGLVPIALSYGLVPSKSLEFLLEFPVESTNQTHVFRAIMGLYFANIAFWLAGIVFTSLRIPALWCLFIFMGGLATGRVLSLVVDGIPSFVLVFYLLAEVAFATLALLAIRKSA
ncbi:MAG: DUF4345 domain-containing protein [Parvibaculaceae bacterium]|nr:DUF4345 domain-containing protein [Parvibaculaceae bacterium]